MPAPPEIVAERIKAVQKTIPAPVTLIAVTKQVPANLIRLAYDFGIRDFGESKIQEAADKQAQLSDLPGITWHLIGHLQSNKARRALSQFRWIHSVDSLKIAQRLNQIAQDDAAPNALKPSVCLQVKLRPDPNKYGWSPEELLQDLPQLNQCDRLSIQGLMVIPPYGLPADEARQVFADARQLSDKIRQLPFPSIQMAQLSMGMSDDYLLAIAEGATMVRLGRTLFGER
ncbi:MAG: YggS family pyridoxal phosphate-dependent enzyme [Elainellaceae cyanobacterium]